MGGQHTIVQILSCLSNKQKNTISSNLIGPSIIRDWKSLQDSFFLVKKTKISLCKECSWFLFLPPVSWCLQSYLSSYDPDPGGLKEKRMKYEYPDNPTYFSKGQNPSERWDPKLQPQIVRNISYREFKVLKYCVMFCRRG